METLFASLALCAGNSPVRDQSSTQRPVTQGIDVFFDLRLNKWLSKQMWGWWLESPSCSLWRRCQGDAMHSGATPRESPPYYSWWRHQMETFSMLLALCAGNSLVAGEFPTQRPVTRSFDVFFDLRLNKWLSKQSWGWWFETPSRSLRPVCNWFYLQLHAHRVSNVKM